MNDIDRLQQEIDGLRERVRVLENGNEEKLITRRMYPGNFSVLATLIYKDIDEDAIVMKTAKNQRGNTIVRILERG